MVLEGIFTKRKMTAKERGNYIKELLSTLTAKEEKILRSYFAVKVESSSFI